MYKPVPPLLEGPVYTLYILESDLSNTLVSEFTGPQNEIATSSRQSGTPRTDIKSPLSIGDVIASEAKQSLILDTDEVLALGDKRVNYENALWQYL